jgi:hypothetical protein
MAFCPDVANIICSYSPNYELLKDRDTYFIVSYKLIKKIDWYNLSKNPAIFKHIRDGKLYDTLLQI